MVSGGVSTNHVGGAAQFLLCRNTTSRYFLPVKLLENFTIMSPPKIIQHQRYKKYSSIPPSGTPRASSPTILNLQQTPSTGEQCSPLHLIRASSCRRKIASLGALFLLYACNLLWSAMLIPHSSFHTPHLTSPLIYSNVIVLCLLH
jgi:hypothetical protein